MAIVYDNFFYWEFVGDDQKLIFCFYDLKVLLEAIEDRRPTITLNKGFIQYYFETPEISLDDTPENDQFFMKIFEIVGKYTQDGMKKEKVYYKFWTKL